MEVLSIPIALIILSGLWFIIFPKVFKNKIKPIKRKYSATVEHLLSLDADQKINNN